MNAVSRLILSLFLLYATVGTLFVCAQSQNQAARLNDDDKARITESLLSKAISQFQVKKPIQSIYLSTENLSATLVPKEVQGVKINVVTPKEIGDTDEITYLSVRRFEVKESMVEVVFGVGWKIRSGHSGYHGNYYDYTKVNGEWVGEKTDEVYFSNAWGPGTAAKKPAPSKRTKPNVLRISVGR
jgi:hypothetical protein